mmetsp:Transcript_27572/g.41291  ORF Transcript_27572/g.41291 Transcript_27572/m.41291 type:complete len:105 (+) Transcript_27572:219-533(+)
MKFSALSLLLLSASVFATSEIEVLENNGVTKEERRGYRNELEKIDAHEATPRTLISKNGRGCNIKPVDADTLITRVSLQNKDLGRTFYISTSNLSVCSGWFSTV